MNSQKDDLHAYDGPETFARCRMNTAAPDGLNARSNADDVFQLLHHSTGAGYKALKPERMLAPLTQPFQFVLPVSVL